MFSNVVVSALAFLVALGLLVSIHEFGHFWVARRVGIKVLRFSVGFGRALYTRRGKVDDTEFVIGAIPLGGYVKMVDERNGKDRSLQLIAIGRSIKNHCGPEQRSSLPDPWPILFLP